MTTATMSRLCGLCGNPADRVVRCPGDACEAHVGPCCLAIDGLCCECSAAEYAKAEHDRRRTAVELRQLAIEVQRGWTSDAIDAVAAALRALGNGDAATTSAIEAFSIVVKDAAEAIASALRDVADAIREHEAQR